MQSMFHSTVYKTCMFTTRFPVGERFHGLYLLVVSIVGFVCSLKLLNACVFVLPLVSVIGYILSYGFLYRA
jgi:hypothetical protein